MRKLTITDLAGAVLGSITESDDGALAGEGKGKTLIQQAPGKTYDDWLEANHHTRYLRYVEEAEAAGV
ncbi:MAG TPA: hypothetical protein VG815_13835 [Chloroflexota bacterium]|jgi:hypothetical protein|nr:hypothetical protein [Chloroflexota bacterium]